MFLHPLYFLTGAFLFVNAAHLAGQQLSFYRGLRDVLLPGVASEVMTAGDVNGDGITDVIPWPSGSLWGGPGGREFG